VEVLVDEVPSFLFKRLKPSPSESVDKHIEKVRNAIENEDFVAWLGTLEIKKNLDENQASKMLSSLLHQWSGANGSKSADSLSLGIKFDEAKQKAVAGSVILDESNLKRSTVSFEFFVKTDKGWTLQLLEFFNEKESVIFTQIKNEFGESKFDMLKQVIQGMSESLANVDVSKVLLKEAAVSDKWNKLVEKFLAVARTDSIVQLGLLSCYTDKERDEALANLVELRSFLRRNQNVKLCEVLQGGSDFSLVVLGEMNTSSMIFKVLLLVETDKGVRADMTNIPELMKKESFFKEALLGNQLGKIEMIYPAEVFNFVSNNYGSLVNKYLK
jgi:hypothetical protein